MKAIHILIALALAAVGWLLVSLDNGSISIPGSEEPNSSSQKHKASALFEDSAVTWIEEYIAAENNEYSQSNWTDWRVRLGAPYPEYFVPANRIKVVAKCVANTHDQKSKTWRKGLAIADGVRAEETARYTQPEISDAKALMQSITYIKTLCRDKIVPTGELASAYKETLAVAAAAPPPLPDQYGSIAVSRSALKYGISMNVSQAMLSDKRAKEACEAASGGAGDCQSVMRLQSFGLRSSCAAIALHHKENRFVIKSGNTESEAQIAATAACDSAYCGIETSFCVPHNPDDVAALCSTKREELDTAKRDGYVLKATERWYNGNCS